MINELLTASGLKNTRITLESAQVLLNCRVCGESWDPKGVKDDEKESIHFIPEVAHAYLRCPKCKSPDFKIVQGRGVYVKKVE